MRARHRPSSDAAVGRAGNVSAARPDRGRAPSTWHQERARSNVTRLCQASAALFVNFGSTLDAFGFISRSERDR